MALRKTQLPTGLDALPKSVRERLLNPPDPGTGVHTWLFSMALAMANVRMDADETVELLGQYIPRDPTPAGEIERQVESAYHLKATGQLGAGYLRRRPAFEFNPREGAKLLDLARSGLNLANLRSALSAISSVGDLANPEAIPVNEVLARLYPEDPLICAGQFFARPYTRRLSEFHPKFLADCAFIVPNPMTAEKGLTLMGKESARSENNVGPRKYGVIEADIKDDNPFWAEQLRKAKALGLTAQDLSAAMLIQISIDMELPVRAVVFSGNVSLHGWFDVAELAPARIEALYRIAISYGACPSTWTLHQWVRMPNGTRWKEDDNRVQPSVRVGPQPLLFYVK